MYRIPNVTLYNWVEKFEKYGLSGLENAKTWKSYSKELKEAAVKDHISGEYSQYEIVRKYKISSRSVLRGWIDKYNSYRDLKDTSKGRTGSMTKGRKNTWDERKQIVICCLEDGKDYQNTADTYEVSYQQVYQCVKSMKLVEMKRLEINEDRIKQKKNSHLKKKSN